MLLQKRLLFILSVVFSNYYFVSSVRLTKSQKLSTSVIIHLQPFDDIPKNHVSYVYAELKKIYSNVVIDKSIPLPKLAYYSKRNRYRADSLIRFLAQLTVNGHVTMGLTSKDISTTKEKIPDYGIMGLAYQPGKSCVVSTFRLSKKDVLEQFFKLSIHELGHTQGLPHCPVDTCFMRDAEGKNKLNQEVDFCKKCKTHLVLKGWQFLK